MRSYLTGPKSFWQISWIWRELRINQRSIRDFEKNLNNSDREEEEKKLKSPSLAKILLIDDDVFSADTLKRIIEKSANCSVKVAENGAKVI